MAKVLFINPIVREEDVPRHVPYGIALLAAISIDRGHQVQVFDQNAWRVGDDVLREVLVADDWDVIGLGGITTAYGSIKKAVPIIREQCPNSIIVLGGGVLTSLARDMMTWLVDVDIGVVGEAFETFPEILSMVDVGKKEWEAIPGTISRDNNNKLVLSQQRELLNDLDTLPYPAWDLFPLEEVYFPNSEVLYSEEGMLASRRLDINASYGCSLICRYCFHLGLSGDMRYEKGEDGTVQIRFDEPGVYNRTIRYHSPEYIVKMVRYAYEKYKINFITFLDENLMTVDQSSRRTWLKEICRLWHENGLAPEYKRDKFGDIVSWSGVHWSGTSHASLCKQEILKTMRAAGCSHLVYGYESFAPHVLKTIGKGANRANNLRSFFWTLEAGIRPVPNQIIGFPNEDFDSIRLNMKAWEELGIVVKPHFATAYPGSEWFTVNRRALERQYDGDLEAFILDLGDASKITGVICKNFSAVELVGLREMMLNLDYRHINEFEAIWKTRQIEEPLKPLAPLKAGAIK